jgi:AcrR family transcriptional regulator
MPRTEEANERIRKERKELVLQAAARVFARKGLADTKVADIAAEAGMSHGLAYRYFETKEELFAAVVKRATVGATQLGERVSAEPGTPWEKLRHLTREMLDGIARMPEYSLVVLHALSNVAVPFEVRELAQGQALIIRDVLTTLIREGQHTGEVGAGDAEQLAMIFLSCIQGLAVSANFLPTYAPAIPEADTVLRLLRP